MFHPHGLTIAIVGSGFSGTALAANLHRYAQQPLHIILFEKTGEFAAGQAYRTPFSYHLLNVLAKDMSVFEDAPQHFVDWLKEKSYGHDSSVISQQFISRAIYHAYLRDLLTSIQQSDNIKLTLVPEEVVHIERTTNGMTLHTASQQIFNADKIVLALGNNAATNFSFANDTSVKIIANPWDYLAIQQVAAQENILIVGTGLSMVDAVLSLHHQQHRGAIYVISRRGLLPKPFETENGSSQVATPIWQDAWNSDNLADLTHRVRGLCQSHVEKGGDWRAIVGSLRPYTPKIWQNLSARDQQRFLRHIASYWNVHRHRLPRQIWQVLTQMIERAQLHILSGRVDALENGCARIKLRASASMQNIKIDWAMNCMGPALNFKLSAQPLVHDLFAQGLAKADEMNLGFRLDEQGLLQNEYGAPIYTLGPQMRNIAWESTAVPEIRKQCAALARCLTAG